MLLFSFVNNPGCLSMPDISRINRPIMADLSMSLNSEQIELERCLNQWKTACKENDESSEDNLNVAIDRIMQCWQLKSLALDLQNLDLPSIPSKIGAFTWIEELFLDDNKLSYLPEELAQLTRLSSLTLSNNDFQSLPDWIGDFSCIDLLYLNGNDMESFPSWIFRLRNLEVADLGECVKCCAPSQWKDFEKLRSLRDLSCIYPGDEIFREVICKMSRLKTLILDGNDDFVVPRSIEGLDSIESLSLINCASFPAEIRCPTRLKELVISYSPQLSSVPDWARDVPNFSTERCPNLNI